MNAIIEKLLERIPERFVNDLNNTVQGVWHDLKPVEPHGKKKGQSKALPVFSIEAGGLQLSSETSKIPRKLLNPIFTTQSGKIASLWAHDAWAEATNRIIKKVLVLTELDPRL